MNIMEVVPVQFRDIQVGSLRTILHCCQLIRVFPLDAACEWKPLSLIRLDGDAASKHPIQLALVWTVLARVLALLMHHRAPSRGSTCLLKPHACAL